MKAFSMRAAAIVMAASLWSCSSGSSSDYPTNPAGAAREFVSGDLAGSGASFSHTFMKAGSFPYYCRYHGGKGGVGMSGVITVTAAPGGYTPVTVPVSITTSTLPSLSIKVGDTITWTNNSGMLHTVESDS